MICQKEVVNTCIRANFQGHMLISHSDVPSINAPESSEKVIPRAHETTPYQSTYVRAEH